ncbi:MAG: holo-ACP synthase [Eggerthellaceae bacterium]|nr:holo-ACP synthase [Eggerthellaceae bacterium]
MILERSPSFETKVFSEDECEYCNKFANAHAHLACRFAAKEAVLKALGIGFAAGVKPTDIEVAKNRFGKPYPILRGVAKEIAEEQGIVDFPLSLSFTHSEAVACAMAIRKDNQPIKLAKKDQIAELCEEFKEAKNIIDEI